MSKKMENLLRTSPQALSAMTSADNPDVLAFSATVAFIDTPTDATPCGGTQGFQTVISSENIDVESLVGSGVNVAYSDWWAGYNFKGHDKHNKIGVIDEAWLEGNEVKVKGHIWKSDFPDIADTIECAKDALGASVEVYFEGIKQDKVAKTLTGLNAHFTGVALLYKSKAAFTKTSIMCSAMDTEGEIEKMNDEIKQALEAQAKSFGEQIEKLTGMVEALSAQKEEAAVETEADAEVVAPAQDFGSMGEAIAKAIADGFASVKAEFGAKEEAPQVEVAPVERKTVQDFSSIENPAHKDNKKSIQELSAEIDADTTLSPAEKWNRQMALWQNRDAE